MLAEDKFMAMRIRRLLAKKMVDMSQLTFSCRGGNVHVSGELRRLRGVRSRTEVSLKDELGSIEQLIRRMHGVRDLTMDVRVIDL